MCQCKMCQQKMEDSANFCPFCGTKLDSSAVDDSPTTSASSANSSSTPSASNPFLVRSPIAPARLAEVPTAVPSNDAPKTRMFFASTKFLTLCILLTCAFLFVLTASIITMAHGLIYIFHIIELLFLIGLWITYGTAKLKEANFSTVGISTLRVATMMTYVVGWVFLALLCFLFVIGLSLGNVLFSGIFTDEFFHSMDALRNFVYKIIYIVIACYLFMLLCIFVVQLLLGWTWQHLSYLRMTVLNVELAKQYSPCSKKIAITLLCLSGFLILIFAFQCVEFFSLDWQDSIGGASCVLTLAATALTTVVCVMMGITLIKTSRTGKQ